MRFTLTGFKQDEGCRVFSYEGIGEDRERLGFTVRADLAVARKFGIRLQELPLLCLAILERSAAVEPSEGVLPAALQRNLTFTEAAMAGYADECIAVREAAAAKRSSPRNRRATDAAAGDINPVGAEFAAAKPYGQNW